jgi:hypothetical protein
MAQGNKAPLFNLNFVPERPQGKKSPWYRCGAIWPTDNPDVLNVVAEFFDLATGKTIRISLMATRVEEQSDNGDNE